MLVSSLCSYFFGFLTDLVFRPAVAKCLVQNNAKSDTPFLYFLREAQLL